VDGAAFGNHVHKPFLDWAFGVGPVAINSIRSGKIIDD
jgi:hypothetical protein